MHEFSIGRFSQLTAGPAIVIAIDDDDGPIVGFAAVFGFRELRRVEGAVATAAHHDDVPQRMSLPPSMTSTVPVT